MGYTAMAMANPPKPLGTFKILREAFTLPTKNLRLIHPILLISLLTSFLLFLGNYLAIRPLLVDLILKSTSLSVSKPNSPEFSNLLATILKDVKELVAKEVIFLIVAFVVWSLLKITMIHATTTTYSGELLTLKELLSRVRRELKGPTITQVYVAVLNMGYLLLVRTFVVVLLFITSGVSIALVLLVLFLSLLAAMVFSLYLTTVLSLSTVISVAEEGCYGVHAIGRAVDLIKGKKKQGTLITLLLAVLAFAIHEAHEMVLVSLPMSTAAQLVAGFVYVSLAVLLMLLDWSAFTVVYYECKRAHGEEAIAMAGCHLYAILPTTTADVGN